MPALVEPTEYHRGQSNPALIRQHRIDIARMLRQEPDVSFAEIGRRLGLTRERVRQLAPPFVVDGRRTESEERERRAIELRQENHTLSEIAQELGISSTTVQNYLREAGLLGVPISRSRSTGVCLLGLHDLTEEFYTDPEGQLRKNYYLTTSGFKRCARCDLARQRRAKHRARHGRRRLAKLSLDSLGTVTC